MYTVTSPVFDKITVELNPKYYNKDKLVIEKISKKTDGFIRRIELNGKKVGFRISHHDLLEAGSLQLSY